MGFGKLKDRFKEWRRERILDSMAKGFIALGMRRNLMCRFCMYNVRMKDGKYVCDNGCRPCDFNPDEEFKIK